MFRPSGTDQCNPKFSKNEFESVMYNHVYRTTIPMYSLEIFYQNLICQGISYLFVFRFYWHKLKTLKHHQKPNVEKHNEVLKLGPHYADKCECLGQSMSTLPRN